jgi:hypothetical protein
VSTAEFQEPDSSRRWQRDVAEGSYSPRVTSEGDDR